MGKFAMLGILFGLLAAVGQGLGYAVLKKSFSERPASLAYFYDMLLGLVIWIPVSIVLGVQWDMLSTVFWYAFLSALLAEAFVFFVLSKGDISLTQPVFSTYPLFTLLFSRYVNGDVLSLPVIVSIICVMVGIIILAFPTAFDKAELKKRALLLWPLAGAIAVGISDSVSKNILDQTSTGTFLFSLAFAQIPVAIGYLWAEKQKMGDVIDMFKNYKAYVYSFLGSFFIVSSLIFFWLAFTFTSASIASPLTATYVVFALLFGLVIVKEKVAKKDIVGIVTTVFGVLALSILVAR